MTRPPRFVVAALTCAALASGAVAQLADLTRQVTRAEKLIKAKKGEEATLILWDVEFGLRRIETGVARKTLRASVDALLQKADPVDAQRRTALAAASRRLLELAARYKRKRWLLACREVLVRAGDLDSAVAAPQLEQVEKALRKQAAAVEPVEEAEAEPEPQPVIEDLLSKLRPREPGWSYGAVVTSPAPDGHSHGSIGASPTHADHWLRLDVQLDQGNGGALFLFGVGSQRDYYAFEVGHDKNQGTSLSLYRYTGGPKMTWLATEWVDFTAAERAAWMTLDVRVRGKSLECRAGGKGPVALKCHTPPRGSVGLFVSGRWPNTGPVKFRNLRIDELPRVAAAAEAAEKKAAPEPDPAAEILAKVGALETRLKAGEAEGVTVELHSLARQVEAMESDTLRASLGKTVGEMIDAADPFAKKRRVARRDVAQILADLAERYATLGRPIAGLSLLDRAALYDRAAAVEPRQKLEKAHAKRIAQHRGLAAEPAVPVDNKALVEWFKGGRMPWSQGWVVSADGCMSPHLPNTSSMLVANRQSGKAGRARVQVRADKPGLGAGLVFAFKSRWEYSMLVIKHAPELSWIEVWRHSNRAWQGLHRAPIKLSPEARSGWITLELEYGDHGISARVGAAPRIRIKKSDLGLRGSFALFAEARDGQSGTLEFRNFEVLPPSK